jgi:uncharacterized coiled-coil protein SlyX
MEPLNSKDRLWAIVKLSLLFLLTFIVFVIAIYFDYGGVPLKENKLLQEENKKFKEEQVEQKKLFQQLDSVYVNLLKLDNDPNGIIKSTIAAQLVSVSGFAKSESKLTSKLANNSLNAYSIILSEKQKVLEGAGLNKDLGKQEKEIKELKDNLKDMKDELKDCQSELRNSKSK